VKGPERFIAPNYNLSQTKIAARTTFLYATSSQRAVTTKREEKRGTGAKEQRYGWPYMALTSYEAFVFKSFKGKKVNLPWY